MPSNLATQNEIYESYEQNFFKRLRHLTGMETADSSQLFDVMDYLEWAVMSGLNLKFKLSDDDLKWIHASVNSGIWRDHWAYNELNMLPAFEFF